MDNWILKVGLLLAFLTTGFAVLPADAAENCRSRDRTDSEQETPPTATGGSGSGGQFVSAPSQVRATETESQTAESGAIEGETCGATTTEASGSQAQDTAMTIGSKINSFRTQQSGGVKGKNKRQGAVLDFTALGGAAGADDRDNALLDGSRFSLFSFADNTNRDREATTGSGGYDQESHSLTLGFDYRIDDARFMGMSISAGDGESDLDSRLGGSEVSSIMLGVHGAQYWDTHYLSAFIAYGELDIDISRITSFDQFAADTDGNYWYGDLTLGAEYSYGALRLSPSMRALFMSGKIDSYTEKSASGGGAVRNVYGQDIDSNILSLAIQADYSLLQTWGVLLPSMRAEFNFDQGDAYKTNGQTLSDADKSVLGNIADQSDEPDSSTLAVSWGVAAQFKRGLAMYAAYERLFLHDYMNKYTATLGLRYELP